MKYSYIGFMMGLTMLAHEVLAANIPSVPVLMGKEPLNLVLVDSSNEIKKSISLLLTPTSAVAINEVPAAAQMGIKDTQGIFNISACNSISGAYQIKNNQFTFSSKSGPSTLVGCPPKGKEALAHDFMADAAKGLTISIKGSVVRLYRDEKFYQFENKYIPSDKAQTKFIEVAGKSRACGKKSSRCLRVRELSLDADSIETAQGPWREIPNNILNYKHEEGYDVKLRVKVDKLKKSFPNLPNPIWYMELLYSSSASAVDSQ